MSRCRQTALVALLLVACGGRAAPVAPAASDERWTSEAGTGEVVATVNGERIYAGDVARQMAARGQTARQALDELVAAELLAEEGRRRGLLADPDVVWARKRERVRAFLHREFEPSFDGPEDIPEEEIDQAWAQPAIHAFFEHEAMHRVAYIRAPFPKTPTPADEAQARAAAEAFFAAARAARPGTKEEFLAIAAKLPPGMKVDAKPEQLFAAMLTGNTQADFARAAFTLQKPGEIAAPVRTPWGYDVLFLIEAFPARHTSRADADAEIRSRRFDAARRLAYQRWVDRQLVGHNVEKREDLLGLVLVDSLVGM